MARMALSMVNGETVRDANAVLRLYLDTPDRNEADQFLETLLTEFALPQIRRIARQKLSFLGASEYQDVDDLSAEVISDLIARLHELRRVREAEGIQSFSAYTASATYRAYNDYLRRKYPQRHRLKAQLRYILNKETRFALWEDARQGWLCGYRDWTGMPAAQPPELQSIPDRIRAERPNGLIADLFDLAGGPLQFDEVVSLVVDLKGLRDWTCEPQDVNEISAPSRTASALEMLERRQWLGKLWLEICALPLPQRKALLLNLRADEGDSALVLLPMAGIATIRQIAVQLEMAAEELAAMWNRLPIDDLSIASEMRLTRQQVINLRKSARERLSRRMAAFRTGW